MNQDLFGKDYLLLQKIGEGSFAEVFKVQQKTTGKFLAIKKLKARYKTLDEVSQINEIAILRLLDSHPNIIKLENVLFDYSTESVALVLEFLEISLFECNQKGFKSSNYCINSSNIESYALLILYQLLKATAYFHSFFIFHRDIKPENIMVNPETLEIKLTDFGSSRKAGTRIHYTDYISTRWYRAPECILTCGSYGPAIDIWAIGCIFYEILSGRPLFPGENELDQISKINQVIGSPTPETLAQFSHNPTKNPVFQTFSFPHRNALDLSILLQTTNTDLVDLIQKMLTYNPTDRISAQEAIHHSAFTLIRQYESEWENYAVETRNKMALPLYIIKKINGESINSSPQKVDSKIENTIFLTKKISLQPRAAFIPETNKEQTKYKAEGVYYKSRMQLKTKNINDETKSTAPQQRTVPFYRIKQVTKRNLGASSIHSIKDNKQFGSKQPNLPAMRNISYQKPVAKIISPQILNNSLNKLV